MKYSFLFIIFVSCSSVEKVKQNYDKQCFIKQKSIEARHASISIKRDPSLVDCFKNYLRFQTNKRQKIDICHSINIRKNGSVSFSSVKRLGSKTTISNDFKMCLEQALWTKNLSSLQLSEKIYINFPISYSSL
jgi:hypothetical protein